MANENTQPTTVTEGEAALRSALIDLGAAQYSLEKSQYHKNEAMKRVQELETTVNKLKTVVAPAAVPSETP